MTNLFLVSVCSVRNSYVIQQWNMYVADLLGIVAGTSCTRGIHGYNPLLFLLSICNVSGLFMYVRPFKLNEPHPPLQTLHSLSRQCFADMLKRDNLPLQSHTHIFCFFLPSARILRYTVACVRFKVFIICCAFSPVNIRKYTCSRRELISLIVVLGNY